MNKIILVIGILVFFEGIAIMVWPDIYRKVVEFFVKGKLLYAASATKIAFGAIFLMAVTSCRENWRWVVMLLGLLMCIGGTSAFFIKLEKLKALMGWFIKRSDFAYRVIGLLAVGLGGLIAYAAWA